jgi:hypothetical protein
LDVSIVESEDITADPISAVLGHGSYVRNHRYGMMQISFPQGGLSPRLRFTRFYWQADPPIAVDMLRDLRFGRVEVAWKMAYCQEQGIAYYVCKDEWDIETLREQAGTIVLPGEAETAADAPVGAPPVSLPRTIPA